MSDRLDDGMDEMSVRLDDGTDPREASVFDVLTIFSYCP
jgi:hypothetical protein